MQNSNALKRRGSWLSPAVDKPLQAPTALALPNRILIGLLSLSFSDLSFHEFRQESQELRVFVGSQVL
jgi:hypothetical protein